MGVGPLTKIIASSNNSNHCCHLIKQIEVGMSRKIISMLLTVKPFQQAISSVQLLYLNILTQLESFVTCALSAMKKKRLSSLTSSICRCRCWTKTKSVSNANQTLIPPVSSKPLQASATDHSSYLQALRNYRWDRLRKRSCGLRKGDPCLVCLIRVSQQQVT